MRGLPTLDLLQKRTGLHTKIQRTYPLAVTAAAAHAIHTIVAAELDAAAVDDVAGAAAEVAALVAAAAETTAAAEVAVAVTASGELAAPATDVAAAVVEAEDAADGAVAAGGVTVA